MRERAVGRSSAGPRESRGPKCGSDGGSDVSSAALMHPARDPTNPTFLSEGPMAHGPWNILPGILRGISGFRTLEESRQCAGTQKRPVLVGRMRLAWLVIPRQAGASLLATPSILSFRANRGTALSCPALPRPAQCIDESLPPTQAPCTAAPSHGARPQASAGSGANRSNRSESGLARRCHCLKQVETARQSDSQTVSASPFQAASSLRITHTVGHSLTVINRGPWGRGAGRVRKSSRCGSGRKSEGQNLNG
jgi:hypothetical protein